MSDRPTVSELLGIVNPWQMVQKYVALHPGSPTVFLDYRPSDPQARYSAAWQVLDVTGKRTDPDRGGHYRNHGRKTFTVSYYADRAAALKAAQEWTSERYGVQEWAPAPRTAGGLAVVPAPVAAWVKAELAAARKRERAAR